MPEPNRPFRRALAEAVAIVEVGRTKEVRRRLARAIDDEPTERG